MEDSSIELLEQLATEIAALRTLSEKGDAYFRQLAGHHIIAADGILQHFLDDKRLFAGDLSEWKNWNASRRQSSPRTDQD